jgi:hypothetical protein
MWSYQQSTDIANLQPQLSNLPVSSPTLPKSEINISRTHSFQAVSTSSTSATENGSGINTSGTTINFLSSLGAFPFTEVDQDYHIKQGNVVVMAKGGHTTPINVTLPMPYSGAVFLIVGLYSGCFLKSASGILMYVNGTSTALTSYTNTGSQIVVVVSDGYDFVVGKLTA